MLDRKAAEEYGRVAADLKQRGRLIQPIDIQVAAIALTWGWIELSGVLR